MSRLHSSVINDKENRSSNSANVNLLVSFCNQPASPFLSLCEADLAGRGFAWVDLTPIPEEFMRDFGGMTGMCRFGEYIAVSTQSNTTSVLVLIDKTGKIKRVFPVTVCKDTHSIVFYDGFIYLVSTGTNEIYRIPEHPINLLGEPELFWKYPEVRYDVDEVHLNGITVTDEGRFVASCFGPKGDDGSWGRDGCVFYIDTGQVIREGLNQPHTPLVVEEQLFFAESAAQRIFVYSRQAPDVWEFNVELEVHGYVRGLAVHEDCLLVGTSRSRKVSRSRETAVTTNNPSCDAAIVRIDLQTYDHRGISSLGAYAREVYDLLPLEWEPELAAPHEALTQRVKEMENTVDRFIVQANELNSLLNETRELATRQEEELRRIYRSFSWNLTHPLQAGKKLIRKIRS